MRVTCDSSGIADLAADLRTITMRAPLRISRTMSEEARLGNELAKEFAKKSAGKHGKLYHRAFSAERLGIYTYTYGPDASMPQGGMSFERGSRNQPPHLDLARSADIVGPRLGGAVLNDVGDLFWPGA